MKPKNMITEHAGEGQVDLDAVESIETLDIQPFKKTIDRNNLTAINPKQKLRLLDAPNIGLDR